MVPTRSYGGQLHYFYFDKTRPCQVAMTFGSACANITLKRQLPILPISIFNCLTFTRVLKPWLITFATKNDLC
ncbi:hypothetical protein DVH24_042364 [Malus domestica]|uniref:Uncharacterized protein n=1 Tax=Malus domestica TaxID=3750 RepID=A0A498J367_MALDO|nr:hypothetical protein DVH24_042364 [Malus domestica]